MAGERAAGGAGPCGGVWRRVAAVPPPGGGAEPRSVPVRGADVSLRAEGAAPAALQGAQLGPVLLSLKSFCLLFLFVSFFFSPLFL